MGDNVISDDPDCLSDFGVDDMGRMVINQESTFLPISELQRIRYCPNVDEFEDTAGYLKFEFNNDIKLCVDLPHIYETEESYYLIYKGKEFDETNAWDIITAVNHGWDGKDEFVITDDGTLVAYLGRDENVVVPDRVVTVGKDAYGRY